MNRSILIVICDFLLLSLLTFSTDINKMAGDNSRPPARVEVATNGVVNTADNDLANAMKLALEEEQHNREQLQSQLAEIRKNSSQQEEQLNARDLANAQLAQQYAAAQTNLEVL